MRWRAPLASSDNSGILVKEEGFSPWSAYQCQTPDAFCPIVGKPGRNDGTASADVKVNANSLKVFPNPSNNHFNIALHFETAQEVNIRIMDSTGKLVFNRQGVSIDAGEIMEEWYPASDLANGLYLLEVSSKDQILREKLILQR